MGRSEAGASLKRLNNFDLPAELAPLSACETGVSKLTRGEGPVSMTRGFMYAGAARGGQPVAREEMGSAVLLGGVHNAGRVAITRRGVESGSFPPRHYRNNRSVNELPK
jgi:hypothetical protein